MLQVTWRDFFSKYAQYINCWFNAIRNIRHKSNQML